MKNLKKILSLSPRFYFLYFQVLILSALARLVVFFVPFRHISRFFGKSGNTLLSADPQHDMALIQEIGLAVTRVSKYTPWRCMCLEQGLIAKILLQFNGIESTLIFGVAKPNQEKIMAHAWLQCGSMIVVGGEKIERFGVIASFI